MIQFIHTADIHFGMENYGKIDAATGIHSRLLDFERALNVVIDTAIERNVDFFLFSGDAYKTATPTPTQQKLLMRCFFRLYAHNIPIVIIVGNHDHPMSFGKATALDVFSNVPVDGFHVVTKPEIIHLTTKNGPINIVGIPWPTRHNITLKEEHINSTSQEITEYISQGIGSIIQQLAAELDPTVPAVLAGHLTVSTGIFSGSEKRAIYGTDPVVLPSQLAIAPFDYVALGHLHRYQNLNPQGYPAVVYAGSIERIDFGERNDTKGFCVVSIPSKGNATHEFITTPMRPFIQLEVTVDQHEEPTTKILQELARYSLQGAIIKIIYHLAANAQDKLDLKAIQLACKDAMYIVSITPIRAAQQRPARGTIPVTNDLQTLMRNYLTYKKLAPEDIERIVNKTLALQQLLLDEELR
ncbi:exonuclease SbcCD subunit D [Candidatus Dependentiae bacterium]|nr:exonuclease SbcCD subunit D [Candidatus Dependentiae bacterium]